MEMTSEEARVWKLLEPHRGKDRAVRVRDLALLAGMDERKLRDVVKNLVEVHAKPIGSSVRPPMGYFVITSEEEREEVRRQYYSRALKLFKRIRAVDRSAWVAGVVDQLELFQRGGGAE